jgi:hypothetical protein
MSFGVSRSLAPLRCRHERASKPSETISKEAMSLLVVYTTPGRLDHFAALVSQQLGQQSALGLAVQDPPDLADRRALSQMSGLRSFMSLSSR